MADLKYWLWLTSRKRMEARKVLAVLDCFVTPERAYYADGEEYGQLPGGPGAWSGRWTRGWTSRTASWPTATGWGWTS